MQYEVTESAISGDYQITMVKTVIHQIGFQETFATHGTVPTEIQVGQEKTNNSYSVTHADTDYFQSNEWQGTDNNWHDQGNGGHPYSDSPPHWNWLIVPANGNYGGLGKPIVVRPHC